MRREMAIADGAAYEPAAPGPYRSRWQYARLPPILVVLALALLLFPEETSLFIGGIRLTVARAVLLIVAPLALVRFGQQITSSSYRFVWSDAIIIPTGLWMFISVSVTDGADRAIVGSGVSALEFVGAYFAARALLTRHGQALALAQLLSILLAIVGLLAPLDTIAGHHVIHDTLGSLTGYEPDYQIDVRRGFLRSAGTLEHPILLGTACVIGTLLGTTLPIAKRCFVFAGTLIGLLVSISSAPMGAIIIGFGCLVYRRLTPGFEARWRVLIAVVALMLALLFTLHPAPFGWLIGHTTFEPGSGYYRLLTWHYAGELVLNAPVFGIGMTDDWARPNWMLPTVDSMWLRSAMSFGIPGSTLIAACLIGACSRRIDTARTFLSDDEKRLGVNLSIIQLLYLFIGTTTSFWGVTWILMGLLAGMRAHLGALGSIPSPDALGSARPGPGRPVPA